ncbi:MAG: TolC family protein [Steroidobacteraceae bacterium]
MRKLGFNLAASIPLGGNAGAIATAEAQRSAAGARMEALQVQVLAAIDAAQLNTAHSLATWNATQQQTRWSDSELERSARRNAAGADDRATLLDARIARDTAALTELDALAGVWQARLALEDALRTPLDAGEITP